eukprot:TRINITY_DN652_c0_g1_i1.p1 TRINITY_DN652_c0_g1~~TRINITY_DN652_c0_g1_i1.p1  ORF type:complete len:332 (-),score=82.62 TRINITY_DN652_c0_g1_i1:1253-2248(-)
MVGFNNVLVQKELKKVHKKEVKEIRKKEKNEKLCGKRHLFCCKCKCADNKYITWWNWFYFLDYFFVVLLIISNITLTSVYEPTDAFQQTFNRISDTEKLEYNYPYLDDTEEVWPNSWSILVYIVIPIFTFIVSQFWVQSLHDFHNIILAYISGFLSNLLFIEFFKRVFGFLRPNFIQHLIERSTDDELHQARQSFPSGHSGNAMFVFLITTFYLFGKLQPYRMKGDGLLFKWTLCWLPILLGIYISITRITDFAHYTRDVFGGWVIGFFIASLFYHGFFYSSFNVLAGFPRIKSSKNFKDVFVGDAVEGNFCCGPCAENDDEEEDDDEEDL